MSKVRHQGLFMQSQRFSLRVGLGALALFATSQISIPLHPVPMTLQTFAMLVIGLTYRPGEAWGTTSLWFFFGALGLPLWSGYSGGLPVLLGPTGGFLVGLWLAPAGMSWLLTRFQTKGWMPLCLCAFVGQAVLFAFGLSYLSLFVGGAQAFALGFMPFLLWNVCKGLLAVVFARFWCSNTSLSSL